MSLIPSPSGPLITNRALKLSPPRPGRPGAGRADPGDAAKRLLTPSSERHGLSQCAGGHGGSPSRRRRTV
eukprot:568663-Hanusia_phi.AAC.1